jgi:pimeloyl-ACP methyl ester carboxylesterase
VHSFTSTDSKTRIAPDQAVYGPVGRSPWLDVDWREHQRWRVVDGQRVNTIELGPDDGADVQTLVFVHGLSGCWANWLEQLPEFASERRVIALDLPGFGASPLPDGEISIARYGRLLDSLLDQLGVDAAAVVGSSMGGFIASELAIAFPQRVERLVLVSAAGITTHSHPGATRAVPTMRRLERIILMSGAWAASKSDAFASRARLRDVTLNLVMRHPSRLPAALAAEQIRGAGKPGFIPALAATIDYAVRERLPEIACPTLIVWGGSDRVIPVADADVFAELVPDSRLVIFEDTGHLSMLERPAAFNSLLRDFLAE